MKVMEDNGKLYREKLEINLIGNALFIGEKKGKLKEVQEILKPYMLSNKSLKLSTICKLNILLNTELFTIPTDKEWLVINRREKLKQLMIVNGELTPTEVVIYIDESGIASIKNIYDGKKE